MEWNKKLKIIFYKKMSKIPKPLNDKEVKAYKPKKRQKIADESGHISFSETIQHFRVKANFKL